MACVSSLACVVQNETSQKHVRRTENTWLWTVDISLIILALHRSWGGVHTYLYVECRTSLERDRIIKHRIIVNSWSWKRWETNINVRLSAPSMILRFQIQILQFRVLKRTYCFLFNDFLLSFFHSGYHFLYHRLFGRSHHLYLKRREIQYVRQRHAPFVHNMPLVHKILTHAFTVDARLTPSACWPKGVPKIMHFQQGTQTKVKVPFNG